MKPNTKMDVHYSSDKMDWGTPQNLFDKLSAKFGPFSLDVAADFQNAKCAVFFGEVPTSEHFDGLTGDWSKYDKCWMNPPYGREIGKWVKKASEESKKGTTVVCLLPGRLGSRWIREYIKKPLVTSSQLKGWTDELGEWIEGDTIIYGELAGRVKFQGAPHAAPFPSIVVVFKAQK